jgi:hypothetical protein
VLPPNSESRRLVPGINNGRRSVDQQINGLSAHYIIGLTDQRFNRSTD